MKVVIIAVLLSVAFLLAHSDCERIIFEECPSIISKSIWGGRIAKDVHYTASPVEYAIIHHSVTPTCLTQKECSKRLRSIQDYHMNEKGFDDIGYNFIIGGDGQVYEGAGWHIVGAHTKGWNSKSIGIGFIGNFTTNKPSSKQLNAGKKFIQCAVDLGELDEEYKLMGARSLRNTESPGNALFLEIQKWDGFTTTPYVE